jgi:hypothetical protein
MTLEATFHKLSLLINKTIERLYVIDENEEMLDFFGLDNLINSVEKTVQPNSWEIQAYDRLIPNAWK